MRRLAAVLLLFALAAAPSARADEPTFRGRTAAEWVREIVDRPASAFELRDASPLDIDLVEVILAHPLAIVRRRALVGLTFDRARPSTALRGPRVVARLGDPDARVRAQAIRALRFHETEAAGAAPALALRLADPDPRVRYAAARLLGRLGPAAGERAFRALAGATFDPDARIRRVAVEALAAVGRGRPLLPALPAAMLGRPEPEVRIEAAGALARAGAAAETFRPVWLAAAKDPDAIVRARAIRALGRDPAGWTLLRPLGMACQDPDAEVRAAAIAAIADLPSVPGLIDLGAVIRALGGPTPSAEWGDAARFLKSGGDLSVRAARRALADPAPRTRIGGLRALMALRPPGAVDDAIRRLTADPDAGVRRTSIELLWNLAKGDAQRAVPFLLEAFSDPDPGVRYAAVVALGWLDSHAVPALAEFMARGTATERELGWKAIERMDPETRLADALSVSALDSPDPAERAHGLRNWFRGALYDADSIRSDVEAAFAAEDPGLRLVAVRVLNHLQRDAPWPRPLLLAALEDSDPGVRLAACDAVGGPFNTDVRQAARLFGVPLVRTELDDPWKWGPYHSDPGGRDVEILARGIVRGRPELRWQAARDLGLLSDVLAPADAELSRGLADADERTREWSARALVNRKLDASGAPGALRAALRDDDPAVRADAALALARTDHGSAAGRAALVELLGADDPDARWQAARALRELGSAAADAAPALRKAADGDADELVRLAAREALRRIEKGEK